MKPLASRVTPPRLVTFMITMLPMPRSLPSTARTTAISAALLVVALSALSWPAPSWAQGALDQGDRSGSESSLEVSVSSDTALPASAPVGAPLSLAFTIQHPREVALSAPQQSGSSRLMLVSSTITPRSTPEQGLYTSALDITLLPLRAGTASLDGLTLGVTPPEGSPMELALERGSIKFISTLGEEQVDALKAPRPPYAITQQDYTPVKIALGLVAALALFGLGYLVYRALKPEPPPPAPLPIDQVALSRLEALQSADRSSDVALVAFYTSLSEIVREYFGARYGFPGTESTTSEILQAMPIERLPASLGLSEITQWLRRADRVKFSSLRPEEQDALADLRRAVAFVELTRPPAPSLEHEPHEELKEERGVSAPRSEDEIDPINPIEEREELKEERAPEMTALGAISWEALSELVDEADEEE